MQKEANKTGISTPYRYYAFISYNSKDTEWGKKVQRKLEKFRLPSTLCSERDLERRPIRPIFFAPTDIQPGPLSEELQERLKASRNLIVICSPNSAKSEWVGREIEFFHNIGRTKNIHFFIIDGIPNSSNPETECFNPIIKRLGLPEILGANIHEKTFKWPWLNKERAYAQLISKLLQVEFDTIWQRHKRLMLQKCAAWCTGIIFVLALLITVWSKGQPIDLEIRLNEISARNSNLPPLKDAIVTLSLDNETKSDTISSISSTGIFSNIPKKFLSEPVRITMKCRNFMDIDTTLPLAEIMTLDIQRDPRVYGNIIFDVWDDNGEGVENVALVIEGNRVVSGKNGHVELFIPLEQQREKYHITATVPLSGDTIYMPCGEDNIISIR